MVTYTKEIQLTREHDKKVAAIKAAVIALKEFGTYSMTEWSMLEELVKQVAEFETESLAASAAERNRLKN